MAQALIKFLDNQYINYDGEEIKFIEGVAGIFGHGCVLGIGEALQQRDHGLKFYRVSNEQGGGHLAIGFAKQNNRKRIMAVTSSVGPGAMNMVTAAGTASANRIPVLFLPGDTYADRQPDPVLQQVENEHDYLCNNNDAFKAVSMYWDRVLRPEMLMSAMINAMRTLTDPAKAGAVTIGLPQDVQAEPWNYPVEFFEKRVHYFQRRPLAPGACDRLVGTIKASKKPLILCGGGVKYSEAGLLLEDFANKHKIPVVETQAGKSAIAWDHPMNLGSIGTTGTLAANKYARETDLLIALGTRLNDFHTTSKWAYQNPDLKVVGINVCAMDAYKLNATPFFADAKLALKELDASLASHSFGLEALTETLKEEWNAEVDRLYAAEGGEFNGEEALAQTRVIGELNKAIGENDIIVNAGGSLPSDLERIWRSKSRDQYHLEYGYSCMGYEIPGGIGAKLANPDREVWVLLGDGTYLMLHTELVTAVQEGLKIIVIVADNGGWQCIDNLQTGQGISRFGCERRFRNPESDLLDGRYVPIDFAANARSYGCEAYTVKNLDDLTKSIEKAKAATGSVLLDVKCVSKSMTDGYEAWWRAGTPQLSKTPAVMDAYKIMKEHLDKARKF